MNSRLWIIIFAMAALMLGVGSSPANGQTPTLDFISPSVARVGSTVLVTLSGMNFNDSDTVNISNPGVTVSIVSVGPTTIEATFVIAPDAPTGVYNVTVAIFGASSSPEDIHGGIMLRADVDLDQSGQRISRFHGAGHFDRYQFLGRSGSKCKPWQPQRQQRDCA